MDTELTWAWLAASFTPEELLLMGANLLLLLFARPLVLRLGRATEDDQSRATRLQAFRAVNLLLLLFVLFNNLVLPVANHSWVARALSAAVIVYLAWLAFHVMDYLIKKRFGRMREVNGEQVYGDTYNARVLSLLSAVLISIMGLIAIVRIMGMDSLLEAGGVIGFIGVLLALTQGAWAPDIIGGLVILNSRLLEEGDVIEIKEEAWVPSVVFKTKVFHTELLNLANNHRVMIANSRLRNMTLHNLSRFASARGLREELRFKVGYDESEERVRAVLVRAYEEASDDPDILLEGQHEPEIRAVAAGDHSIEWGLFYHVKDVRKLLRTRQLLLGTVIRIAASKNLSLSTPVLHRAVSGVD